MLELTHLSLNGQLSLGKTKNKEKLFIDPDKEKFWAKIDIIFLPISLKSVLKRKVKMAYLFSIV